MTAARNISYTYQPLSTPTTIRLLVLAPGSGRDPLQGELQHADLSFGDIDGYNLDAAYQLCYQSGITVPPPYEAISYVWGAPIFKASIMTRAGSIALTQNLADALLRFRLPDNTRILWADAICINQADPTEQGHQVRMMDRIYSSAETVLVWLGPDQALVAQEAFESIRNIFKKRPMSRRKLKKVRDLVNMITETEWFSRLWIVQEILLAQRAFFFWGTEVVPFEYLEAILVVLAEGNFGWLTHKKTGMFKEIWHVLDDYRKLRCSDKRDHIYAILGLPYSNSNHLATRFQNIQPDYRKSWRQLAFEVACMYIETDNIDTLLSYVNHTDGREGCVLEELPSWIPDWSAAFDYMPTLDRYLNMPYKKPIINNDELRLTIFGTLVDSVLYTTRTGLGNYKSPRYSTHILGFWTYISTTHEQPYNTEQIEEMISCFLQASPATGGDDRCALDFDHLMMALLPDWNTTDDGRDMIASLRPRVRIKETVKDHSNCIRPIHQSWSWRKLFQTSQGYIGLGPAAMQCGDIVVRLSGLSQSAIVRTRNQAYIFVGCAYIPRLESQKCSYDQLHAYELC